MRIHRTGNDTRAPLSRRAFLAASLAAPLVLGRTARGADSVVTGHIGVGRRGRVLLEELRAHAAAVCDVDRGHLHEAASIVGPGVRAFADYRELLARREIDAVVIAAPDHWQALLCAAACAAGKDVYVETPGFGTLAETRLSLNAARTFASVVQAGAEEVHTRAAGALRAYLAGGALGAVTRVDCRAALNPAGGRIAEEAPPEALDYDAWLGPMPWTPYQADGVHEHFRWRMDFGGGRLRHEGLRLLSVVLYALQRETLGRVRIEAGGPDPAPGLWDCPPTLEAQWTLTGPDCVFTWRQDGAMAPGTAEAVIHGEQGDLQVRLDAAGLRAPDAVMGAMEDRAPDLGGGPRAAWLESVRTREEPRWNLARAAGPANLANLANLAWRLRRPLVWDGEAGNFVNDAAADRHLGPPGRGAWHW